MSSIPKELKDSLSKEEIQLLTNLMDVKWRLNNLYTIKDKDGKELVFSMNYAQEKVYSYKHKRIIILKSRQQGISTLELIINLDKCLFIPGFEGGIQSYGKNESKKLANRVKLAWDRFPDIIKKFIGISVVKMNSDEIIFSNRSILKIGNFRGDTLQSLHVSELGKIAKKFPDKAEELKTGAFQAVSTNNSISIESTAEGASGLFFDMWNTAEKAVKTERLTKLDFQPIFLSWVEDPDCRLYEEVEIPKELEEYFSKAEENLHVLHKYGSNVTELTKEQKWWYVKKKEELGFKIKQEYPTFPKEAFEMSVEGTYYASEYETLKLKDVEFNSSLLVHSVFDLGMNDTFSIFFFQIHPGKGSVEERTKVLGEYENNGEGLEFYRDVFKALTVNLGWQHGETYVPHDIKVKELIAGKTRWQAMKDLGWKPRLVKRHKVQDGIEATRQFLKKVTVSRDLDVFIGAVQNYRKRKDDKLNVYLDSPLHDRWSHPADAIRYLAMGLRYNEITNIYARNISNSIYKRRPSGYDI